MKKIVINACYGGFSLSYEAVMRYAELKGEKIYGYMDGGDPFDINRDRCYVPYNPKEDKKPFCIHYATLMKDKLTNKELNDNYWDNISGRDDPILIQVVEELGEKADGDCANLKIVEIPDDVEWEIDEYDGYESIEEKHRSWS